MPSRGTRATRPSSRSSSRRTRAWPTSGPRAATWISSCVATRRHARRTTSGRSSPPGATDGMTRVRSHWGWGWANKFPDGAGRRAMGETVRALLGAGELRCDEPVPIEQAEVRRARVEVPGRLASIATDERNVRVTHTYGRAYRDLVRGFGGDFRAVPDVVATP